jgi:hypothetical protein
MSERYFTQEIYEHDCVGDSSAKYNYNFLNLDTEICNLSSQFYIGDESFFSVFTDFSANTADLIQMADIFYDPLKFKKLNTVTRYLSSYWSNHEFTIHYPLNISLIEDFPISCPTINQTDDKLISLARSYILNLYKPYDYIEGTKMNVVFFLYNVPSNPNNPEDLISRKTSAEFSYSVRHMYAEMVKQDVHLSAGKILKFLNKKNQWNLISIESGTSDITRQPVLKNEPPPRITILPPSDKGRQTININVNRNYLNFDLYYHVIHSGIYFAGFTDVLLTIDNGFTLGSNINGGSALTISGFVNGDVIKIVNNGNILGYGGQAGDGQDLGNQVTEQNNGKNGGTAIKILYPIESFTNNGLIAGGGGGGAGGLAAWSTRGYMNEFFVNPLPQSFKYSIYNGGGGGGGGAGSVVGSEGKGGNPNLLLASPGRYYSWVSNSGNSGTPGTAINGGSGGNGHKSGATGGALGQNGVSTGVIDFLGRQLPPIGGRAGAAIEGTSFIKEFKTTLSNATSNYGDIRGSI